MKTHRIFYFALLVSVVIHLLFIQFFSYQQDAKKQTQQTKKSVMDVALLAPEVPDKQPEPKHAQAISNKNQQARKELKANEKKAHIATAPKATKIIQKEHKNQQKPIKKPMKKNEVVEKKVQQKPRTKPTEKVSHIAKKENMNASHQKEEDVTKKTYKPFSQMNLNPSNASINKISTHVQKESRMQSMLSSEADIPINTREEKYAPYAQALVRALEEQWRPGQEDYEMYSLLDRQVWLRITINRQGKLEHVEILRPSPIASLTESALKALRDAAPYRALPSSWGFDRVSFRLTFQLVADRAIFRTY